MEYLAVNSLLFSPNLSKSRLSYGENEKSLRPALHPWKSKHLKKLSQTRFGFLVSINENQRFF